MHLHAPTCAAIHPPARVVHCICVQVPVALMDGIIGLLDFLARFFPGLKVRH